MFCFIPFQSIRAALHTSFTVGRLYSSTFINSLNFQSAWVVKAHTIISISKIAEPCPDTQKISVKVGRRKRVDRVLEEKVEQEEMRALLGGRDITALGVLLERTECFRKSRILSARQGFGDQGVICLFIFRKRLSWGQEIKERWGQKNIGGWRKSRNPMSGWMPICKISSCSKWLHRPESWIFKKEHVIAWRTTFQDMLKQFRE